ncbi:MAG: hypothetical protein VB020_04820 [Methanocorpusculum sp.]|nr:hypothetical protein [Methanocorpusculum sp.]
MNETPAGSWIPRKDQAPLPRKKYMFDKCGEKPPFVETLFDC